MENRWALPGQAEEGQLLVLYHWPCFCWYLVGQLYPTYSTSLRVDTHVKGNGLGCESRLSAVAEEALTEAVCDLPGEERLQTETHHSL